VVVFRPQVRAWHPRKISLGIFWSSWRVLGQSINRSCIFRVVQVIKSLKDPMEVGNNLSGAVKAAGHVTVIL